MEILLPAFTTMYSIDRCQEAGRRDVHGNKIMAIMYCLVDHALAK
jgi:hypothetical protein